VVAAAAPAVAAPAAPTPAVAPAPPPPPTIARLEGVTLLGGRREATFRVADDTMTVAEGEPVGDRRATRVSGNGVDLADAGAAVEAVRLGGGVAVSGSRPRCRPGSPRRRSAGARRAGGARSSRCRAGCLPRPGGRARRHRRGRRTRG